MKQLTCEMCGSTELIKKDGNFECQTCGTKYSVEDAKKMMIEGTVEVTGKVQVGREEEIENLLKRASNTLIEIKSKLSKTDNMAEKCVLCAIHSDQRNMEFWDAKFLSSANARKNFENYINKILDLQHDNPSAIEMQTEFNKLKSNVQAELDVINKALKEADERTTRNIIIAIAIFIVVVSLIAANGG